MTSHTVGLPQSKRIFAPGDVAPRRRLGLLSSLTLVFELRRFEYAFVAIERTYCDRIRVSGRERIVGIWTPPSSGCGLWARPATVHGRGRAGTAIDTGR